MASIHKRVTAKGEIRWLVRYRDPNRAERTRSFRLKTDAARFAAAVETDISRGDWVNPELARETFSYWADQWLATTYHLKPKTQESYRSVLNHHLLPRLAHTPVARIDLPTVTSLLSELSRNGAGAGTVGNIRGALGLVLEQARRSGAIRTNPVADTKPPRKPQQEMIFLTPREVIAVAEEVTDPPIKKGGGEHRRPSFPERGLLVRLAGFTGLRAGEITALRVSAVDLTTMQILVLASASEAHGQLQFGPPKNWRRRSVPLPGGLAEDLTDHIRGKGPREFVFTSARGTPVRQSNFHARHFKPAALRVGLDSKVRFHDLRHSYAAMLIAQGAHPRAIMERLGHSSIQVTLDTYGHLFPELEAHITEGLDEVYRGVVSRSGPISRERTLHMA
jgi:integrase